MANRINAGTIHSSKIQTDTITALQIAADAITASEIQAGAITAEKIALGVLRRNLIFDGSFEDSYAFTNWDPFTTGQGNTAQWRNAPGGSTAGLGPVRDTTGKRTRSGNNAVNLTVGAGQVATMISNTFPTIVGQTYRLVVNACSLTALANMVVDVQVADVIGGIDGFNPITITGDTGWVLSPRWAPNRWTPRSSPPTRGRSWRPRRSLHCGSATTLRRLPARWWSTTSRWC